VSGETSSDVSTAIPISTPANEVHDFHDIAVLKRQ
jgi:hypothetical protein